MATLPARPSIFAVDIFQFLALLMKDMFWLWIRWAIRQATGHSTWKSQASKYLYAQFVAGRIVG